MKDKIKNMDKDKKALVLLGSLAVALFVLSLFILSFLVKEKPTTSTQPTETEQPNEVEVDEGKQPNDKEEATTNEQNDPEDIKPIDPNESEFYRAYDAGVPYYSEALRITFTTPSSWQDNVTMFEDPDKQVITFMYQDKYFLMSIRAIRQNNYEKNQSFYDVFYHKITQHEGMVYMHGFPNSHPIGDDKDSVAYNEYIKFHGEVDNLLKTVKAK